MIHLALSIASVIFLVVVGAYVVSAVLAVGVLILNAIWGLFK